MSPTWDEVWQRRTFDETSPVSLLDLMRADGLDTGFGSVSESDWLAGVRRVCHDIRIGPGDSVYEVGCGAGAFLYDLYDRGLHVGGLDRSAALITYAQRAMPGGRFRLADASALDTTEQVDAVLAFGVLMYFPSLEYSRQVITSMARKARRCVALLDVPDAARKAQALARRVEVVGGPEAYAQRYAGLEHQYFDRTWMQNLLGECGLVDVHIGDQCIAGYDNAAYRFNAWGFVRVA